MLGLSVADNLALSALGQLSRLGIVDAARAEQAALARLRDLSIKVPGLGAEVATLSGGNQQKVVIGKWLELAPRVLLLDEPTRGVDVGAKAEIYALIEELTARGHAVVLASSDLPEVSGSRTACSCCARAGSPASSRATRSPSSRSCSSPCGTPSDRAALSESPQ